MCSHLFIIAQVKRILPTASSSARFLSQFFVQGCWAAELADGRARRSFAGGPQGAVRWEARSCRPVVRGDIAGGRSAAGTLWPCTAAVSGNSDIAQRLSLGKLPTCSSVADLEARDLEFARALAISSNHRGLDFVAGGREIASVLTGKWTWVAL